MTVGLDCSNVPNQWISVHISPHCPTSVSGGRESATEAMEMRQGAVGEKLAPLSLCLTGRKKLRAAGGHQKGSGIQVQKRKRRRSKSQPGARMKIRSRSSAVETARQHVECSHGRRACSTASARASGQLQTGMALLMLSIRSEDTKLLLSHAERYPGNEARQSISGKRSSAGSPSEGRPILWRAKPNQTQPELREST